MAQMTYEELISAINDYVDKKRVRSKPTVKKFLLSDGCKSLPGVIRSYETESISEEEIWDSMRDLVAQEKKSKGTVIELFRDFWEYLKQTRGFSEGIFPPIPVDNLFERRLFIAKYLQNPAHRIEDLANILWVNIRTIENDLQVLRGDSLEEKLQANGQAFTIPDTSRKNGHLYMGSTLHPIFLSSNLTQVIAMLRGLKLLTDDPVMKGYAWTQARNIWMQLSDYAKNRILYVTQHLMVDNYEWYRTLESPTKNGFQTESQCGSIVDCLKNGKTCCIEYQPDESGETIFYRDCAVLRVQYPTAVIRPSGMEEIVIQLDKIVRSAYHEELMI